MQVLLGDAMRKIQFSFRVRNKGGPLAGNVGELADNKLDPIAEYLFSELTSNRRSNIDLDMLL